MLLGVTECTELDVVLPAIARALEVRGVAGTIDLHELPELPWPPSQGPLLECRVRVLGARLHPGPFGYVWRADPQAYEQFLGAAGRWCRRRDEASCSLLAAAGTIPSRPARS